VNIERLRAQQIRNFFALTLLSVGTPMLLMGDEARRTQRGNNNAYCQDNEISWFDWSLCAANSEVLRFAQHMIRVRLDFCKGIRGDRITLEEYLSKARIEWHGVELGKPDWGVDSHSVAFTLHSFSSSQVRYIAINAYWKPLEFELPPVTDSSEGGWLRLIDTSVPSANDILEETQGVLVEGSKYLLGPRSVIMLHHDYATEAQSATHHPS